MSRKQIFAEFAQARVKKTPSGKFAAQKLIIGQYGWRFVTEREFDDVASAVMFLSDNGYLRPYEETYVRLNLGVSNGNV
jgi:hypothetical protein